VAGAGDLMEGGAGLATGAGTAGAGTEEGACGIRGLGAHTGWAGTWAMTGLGAFNGADVLAGITGLISGRSAGSGQASDRTWVWLR
jgi:hypothetical protein